MTVQSLKVTVPAAGTPVAVTSDATLVANRVVVSGLPANTQKAYFGNSDLSKATLAGVINKPLAASAETEMVAHSGSNVFRLADFLVDADVNGEGVLVTYYTL
jgi:hypothetical protein